MSMFSSIFDQSSFSPDYRDLILYNGQLPFRATGKFKGNLIEFVQISNSSNVILFNTNQTRQQYLDYHNKFELFRNKDLRDFIGMEVVLAEGVYYPTGRWFFNKDMKLWELMKYNNPQDVIYFGGPLSMVVDDQFIIGKKCTEVKLHTKK